MRIRQQFCSIRTICGVEEAGRGALAGPLVLAAVTLPHDFSFHAVSRIVVRDSKELSLKQRLDAYHLIRDIALSVECEILSVAEINTRGINWANIEGFCRLVKSVRADHYVIDGRWNLPPIGKRGPLVECRIKADQSVPAAMAAGIVAKINRDRLMLALHQEFPFYGWKSNTGHGTKEHLRALIEHGSCDHHRGQFVRTALRHYQSQPKATKFCPRSI